ncbi:MAG: F0F1 ATP synthase subunit B [Deltaproteobacteria bacterium]|nr:F0F1 ATP synthase subunit B [Deltaproteobacteria bacterium]
MELLEPLGLDFKLVAIQLFGFLILWWMLKKFLFGRVVELIQKRGDEIKGAYEDNERVRDEVQALKADYEKKLQEAREEAAAIIQKATEQAEKAGQEIVESTRQEANQIKERGLAQIEQEKKKIVSEIRTDVINLSVEIARRLIAKSIAPDEAEKLTDDVIKQIGGISS